MILAWAVGAMRDYHLSASNKSGGQVRSSRPVIIIFNTFFQANCQKETAETIAEKLGLSVIMLKEFRETNNGDLAGISKAKFQTDYPGLFYSSLEWDQRYPNGESPALFFTRIKNAWQSFKSEASALSGNTLLVTHGGVIDVILCLENGENYTNKRIHYHVNHAEIIRAV